jgi:hypothetical protein
MGDVMQVFFRALILAEKACAPAIGIDHLLAALDGPATEEMPLSPPTGPFVPAEKREMFFSSEAVAVIESLGGLQAVTKDRLRSALLAAKIEAGKRSSAQPAIENGA